MINDIKHCLKRADIVGVIQDVGTPFAKDFIHSGLKDLLIKHNSIPSFLILNKVMYFFNFIIQQFNFVSS